MYTVRDFKSKKELKTAVESGEMVRCYSPGPFPCPMEGDITLEGPHYPKPHKWYATAEVKNEIIVKGTVK
jgi:hypothetical protein